MLPRILTTFALLASLTACGGGPTQAPIVDRQGVTEAKHTEDVVACYRAMPFFAFGNPITTCMRDKGYTILVGF